MVLQHQEVWYRAAWSPVLTRSRLRGATLFTVLFLLLGFISKQAPADSFGRYGYDAFLNLPDLKVSLSGFSAKPDGSDEIAFLNPAKSFRVVSTHATAQVVELTGGAGAPSQARASLLGNCLDLFFQKGAYLRLRCEQAPFLSWKEGSVGPHVPTPDLEWALLSFQTPQPPIMLGFSGKKASFEVTGKAGAWILGCPNFSGWLRVLLPLGTRAEYPTDASGLGTLSAKVAKDAAVWSAKTPVESRVKIVASDTAVDAEWSFDGSGVFIPPAATLAELGGSSLSITSPHHSLQGGGQLGPYQVTDGSKLVIHFPVHKIRPGRALGIGSPPQPSLSNVKPDAVDGVVRLALEMLLANQDSAISKVCDQESAAYINGASYTVEPCTGQQLPFSAAGDGIKIAAAHALLAQASQLVVDSNDTNGLFDSLLWRRDWWTWMICANDLDESRRACALAAVAGAMSNSPTARLYAATLEAGLDAQTAEEQGKTLAEPLLGLREGIFELKRKPGPELEFYKLLQSPFKVGEGPALTLQAQGKDLMVSWPSPGSSVSVMTFFNVPGCRLTPLKNLPKFSVSGAEDSTSITYLTKEPGECAAKLVLPDGFPPLPKVVPIPGAG
ncbi:MAG TPA: hypothetical protein VG944_10630 [Fimbriimonas sp.]|nr:hypothetical protein [Fimbriimonas sp.]